MIINSRITSVIMSQLELLITYDQSTTYYVRLSEPCLIFRLLVSYSALFQFIACQSITTSLRALFSRRVGT